MARTVVIDQLKLHKFSVSLDSPAPGINPASAPPRVYAEYSLIAAGRRVQLEHAEIGTRLTAARRQQVAQLVTDLVTELTALEGI
jgi:hypothetical protein